MVSEARTSRGMVTGKSATAIKAAISLAQKPLRRNSRPSMPGVELGESPRQAVEHLIDKRADQAQRMVRRYTPFDVNVSEELDRPLVNSAHRAPFDTCESTADMRLGNHIQTVSKTHFFS